jgi:hypothetical protein
MYIANINKGGTHTIIYQPKTGNTYPKNVQVAGGWPHSPKMKTYELTGARKRERYL